MSTALSPRPSDRPPEHEPWGRGVVVSVAAHLALVAALWWGVHWHKDENEGVSAELWSAVPEAAAPRAVEPPPPAPVPAPVPAPAPPPVAPPPPVAAPKPPDIVTEQLKEKEKLRQQQEKEKLEQQKLAQQKEKEREKAEQQKAEQQAKADAARKAEQQKQLDAQKLAKLHDENVKRMLAQMNGTGAPDATGTAARSKGPSAGYAGRIMARVKPNILGFDPATVDGNPEADVEVRCAPDGTIIGRRLTKSSGVKAYDEAVLRALDRTAVLPRDTDGSIPSPMTLVFHPQDA